MENMLIMKTSDRKIERVVKKIVKKVTIENGQVKEETITTETITGQDESTPISDESLFEKLCKLKDNIEKSKTVTKDETMVTNGSQDSEDKTKGIETVNPVAKSSNFEQDCLQAHNNYRAKHGVQPMTINPELTKLAQDWANQLASTGKLTHRSDNKHGENLYWSSSKDDSAESAVKAWYNEIHRYKWDKQGFSSGTGHFTQVVWKDSTMLGCSRTVASNGTYIVCNYSPAGNFMGKFRENVLPPKEG